MLLPLPPKCFETQQGTVKAFLFYDKESIKFPTHYFLIFITNFYLRDLNSHKARIFNQSEYAIYLNFNTVFPRISSQRLFQISFDGIKLWFNSINWRLNPKVADPQVVETSVTVNNNSPIQDYVHPDGHTQPT